MQTTRQGLRLTRKSLNFIRTSFQGIATQSKSIEAKKWQIVGAVCAMRKPVVSQVMSSMEQEYSRLLNQMEVELSLKSDHEVRIDQDFVRAQLMKSGDVEDVDLDEASKQTALEFEDACTEELQAFSSAPTHTAADKDEDRSSLDHALERLLVLAVKQKLGDQYHWVLPQGPWQSGETLRQTCERVLKEKCGNKLNVKMLGNAPSGFFKYKFPLKEQNEYIGAKVFFYEALVLDGPNIVQPGDGVEQHEWLSLEQLEERFKPSYSSAVGQFMISDT